MVLFRRSRLRQSLEDQQRKSCLRPPVVCWACLWRSSSHLLLNRNVRDVTRGQSVFSSLWMDSNLLHSSSSSFSLSLSPLSLPLFLPSFIARLRSLTSPFLSSSPTSLLCLSPAQLLLPLLPVILFLPLFCCFLRFLFLFLVFPQKFRG